MSADIVERLRGKLPRSTGCPDCGIMPLHEPTIERERREAADEIERLRRPPSEAVEKCARIADEWCERNGWPNGAWGIAAEIRSLLEEKF